MEPYRKDTIRMETKRKKRMSKWQAKRLRTLRANKSREQIVEDARKAGKASTTHFNSEKAREANRKRWEAYRARKAAQEAQSQGE